MSEPAGPEPYTHLLALLSTARTRDAAGQASLLAELAEREPELARELVTILRHEQRGAEPLADELARTAHQLGALSEAAGAGGARREDETVAAPETVLPTRDFEFLTTLAEGGMGRVMLARQRSLHREVAIKVLKPGRVAPQLVSGLLHEAIISGSLEHPNIVPVHVVGVDEKGMPMLVMKRVEGVPWHDLVDDPHHPVWACVPGADVDRLGAHLSILSAVCNAIGFAHSRGVLHLDVKPHNVMVGRFGEVHLVDWGIATRMTAPAAPAGADGWVELPPGGLLGTPAFMAPEMASDGPRRLDARTDVYLLGATLHYALTGTPRHGGRTAIQRLMQAQRSEPVKYGPEVPEELAALCNRATHVDPAERFASPAALAAALADFRRHRGSVVLSEGAAARLELLRQAVAPAGDGSTRLHDLMTECYFGFEESLRAWPENPRAHAGLAECLDVMVRHEVSLGNLARAQALLSKLREPSAELTAAVDALAAEVQARVRRESRLREIERQRDWTTGARPRAVFLGVSFVLAVAVWRMAVHDGGAPEAMSPERMALYLGLGVALVFACVVVLRRWLFQTVVSRGLVLGLLCCFLGMLVNRCLQIIPSPQTAVTVATDQVLAATAAAVGAATLARWLILATPILLAGALFSRLVPSLAGESMAVTLGLGLALCLFALSRARQGDTPRLSPPTA